MQGEKNEDLDSCNSRYYYDDLFFNYRDGLVSLDRQKRFISGKKPVYIAACF